MKYKIPFFFVIFFVFSVICLCDGVSAEEPKTFIPDKALCAKMLRFGKEAYMRGKYLDAKAYFRKAVQADPNSPVAWRYYDLAAVFALAEKVEQNADLIAPGASQRQEAPPLGSAAPPSGAAASTPSPASPPKKPPAKKFEFKIVDDEGC